MGRDPVIDAHKQFVDLFKKEEMLAFFDFLLPLAENRTAAGLCKISRPKGDLQQGRYLALLFLIDAPDEALREEVTAYAKRIPWNHLAELAPGIETVLSIPDLHSGSGFYYKETDLYVSGKVELSKAYVVSKLFPAILRVTGFSARELVFWEDVPAEARGEAPNSFKERLKDLFLRR
jgi:hypothetical protein